MRYGFFENTTVYAEDFAKFAGGLLTNGVLADTDNALKVSAGSGMQVNIAPGYCWINGHYGVAETVESLTIPPADGSLGRIDRVVARLDLSEPAVKLYVLKGEAATVPTAPAPVRDGNYYDLGLATVNVPAGTIAITASLITDTRDDEEVCGAVIYRNADKMALDGKANKSDIANPFVLPCRNLGEVFAKEIAEFDGDAYAWIQSRIRNNNISDIYLGDYLPPFQVEWNDETYDYTPRVWRMEKSLNGSTPYIDFQCDELWISTIPWSNVTNGWSLGINVNDATNGVKVYQSGSWESSNLYLKLNNISGYCVKQEEGYYKLDQNTPKESGDAKNNVIGLFPDYVKEVMADKRKYTEDRLPKASTDKDRMTLSPYTDSMATRQIVLTNAGKLWIPSEYEQLGSFDKTDSALRDKLPYGTYLNATLTALDHRFINKKRYFVNDQISQDGYYLETGVNSTSYVVVVKLSYSDRITTNVFSTGYSTDKQPAGSNYFFKMNTLICFTIE